MRNDKLSASVCQRRRIRLKCVKNLIEWTALMSMVTVEHLHKVFGRFTAVKDASFTIEKGEIVGFLGPNGAGKTTTMKMLTGYRKMDERKVEGKNADATRQQIRSAMDVVIKAFEKQLDTMHQDDLLDISTDIDVLETMLKQDGLIDSGIRNQQ